MNNTTIFSTIIASTIAVLAVFAVSSSEVQAEPPSKVACPAENVQHWATYHWKAGGTITHPMLPSLTGTGVLEIPVPSDRNYLEKEVVLARLIDLGYLDEISQPLEITDIFSATSGDSSTICAEN